MQPSVEGAASMYAAERQAHILSLARRDGRVEVSALAADLAVTPETVRRDLTALERRGGLRRVHGGAIPVERMDLEPTMTDRTESHSAEKARIAKAALDLVPEQGTVLIDGGTTTALLAQHFPTDRDLTVVTTSLPVANALVGVQRIDLHLIGGYVRGRTLTAVGDWVIHALADLCVDVAFLGTNGISVARGLTTPDQREASAKRAMVEAARQVVVLADHTKVGVDHFARFASLSAVSTVITDSGVDPEDAEALTTAGPEVIRA